MNPVERTFEKVDGRWVLILQPSLTLSRIWMTGVFAVGISAIAVLGTLSDFWTAGIEASLGTRSWSVIALSFIMFFWISSLQLLLKQFLTDDVILRIPAGVAISRLETKWLIRLVFACIYLTLAALVAHGTGLMENLTSA